MSTSAFGSHFPPKARKAKPYIDVEVHDGVSWVSLNDHYNFVLGARTLEQSAQQMHKHSVKSAMFDGEFITHTTLGNVTETLEIYILGADQVHVGDNMQKLIAAFSQPSYLVRRTFGTDRETWRCFPSEYTYARGHTMIHNTRATLTFNVPRLPKITREVVE